MGILAGKTARKTEGQTMRKTARQSARADRAARALRGVLCTLAMLAAPGAASAQTWPNRTVTAIVPLAAGNAIDIVGRIVLEQVSKQIGQPIVVENRVGAGGTVGAAAVAKAAPDGYTILVHSSSIAIAPALYSKLPYDTVGDFAAIIPLGIQPSVLVTSPAKGFATVADLVAAAKAKPGVLNYASAGAGSTSHLAAVRLLSSARIDMQHVPFRGPTDAITGVLRGEIDFYFLPLSAALPLIKEHSLVALAVSTTKRAAALPDVPTTIEAGLPDSTYEFWVGMFAPSKTPPETIARLYQETERALQSPALKQRLDAIGVEPMPMTRTQFGERLKGEVVAIGAVAKAAGITPVN